MTQEEKDRITFRQNKDNKGLLTSLRHMARGAGRSLNNYLNYILQNHVKEHNDTNEE